ncbi:hypothetical protein CROQUDRAFT_132857 [Cronartium quercuum f. sp. fusiforme G11]|uniref:Uncharacterized protein n=1 Tax=Cronartium quercuum f. sp. fusiforme G11 TaxID=708437 RepID=A0A9P6TCM3_9BASI|nr:hypothetical protein CROQUDRAFT_132857 [Cronartium quercuum f. sp. fusiforme G11]
MSSSSALFTSPFQTSSATTRAPENMNTEKVIGLPIAIESSTKTLGPPTPTETNCKVNLPHVRRASSWIEDDPGECEDGDEEQDETPTKNHPWRPYKHSNASDWAMPVPMPDYASDVESVDLDDLPPSPPPLRYHSRSSSVASQRSLDEEGDSETDEISEIAQPNSFFVPPRSAWATRRPRRLNGLGHSISLPTLPTRHSQSVLVSPAGSPIIEEEDPMNVDQGRPRAKLQALILGLWVSPFILALLTLAKLGQSGLRAIIRTVNFLDRFIGSIKRQLESFNAFIENLTLAIGNLDLSWKLDQKRKSKNLVRINGKKKL